jgi:tropomyosin-1
MSSGHVAKIKELEEELHIVTSSLRSLEISDSKASSREVTYEETIKDLNERLKEYEMRTEEAEAEVKRLQRANDKLEDSLAKEKEAFKALEAELESTLKDLGTM